MVGHLDDGAQTEHPNCACWMDYITSPEANAAVAEWFGEARANAKACDVTADKTLCDTYHAGTRRTPTGSGSGTPRSSSASTGAPT